MRVAARGSIREFVLDRPGKLNALDASEWSQLRAALREAEDEPAAHVVVLRAEGRAFCAGNDITATREFRTAGEAKGYFLDLMLPTLTAVASSRLPVIAEVKGPALGGGFELIQYCDVVIAAESATFGLPETGIGLWATIHLATSAFTGDRRVAQYMALTGERLSAAQAHAAQLVSEVVADGEVESRVDAVAEAVAAAAPRATAFTKSYANAAVLGPAHDAVRRALTDLVDRTLFEDEAREGMAAFTERRPARF